MNARVTFSPKPDKLVDTMLYLASKGIELSQYKMVKLLYLADREHLRRFGRPITFDKYVAMPFGPVASAAFDLLKGKKALGIDPSDLPFERRKHDKIILVEHPKRDIDRAIFSRSDLVVLDQTVDKYGHMSFDQLYKLTHEHFAYDRAWKGRKTKADDMRFEDFLAEDASKEDRVSDLSFTSRGMWPIATAGDIFKFRTDQVVGHENRDKYHVAIELSKLAFLFISSHPFEGAMKIDRTDWPEMPKEESYISCSNLVRYKLVDLKGIPKEQAGRLSNECLSRLEAHVASSFTLTIVEIDIILNALSDYASD